MDNQTQDKTRQMPVKDRSRCRTIEVDDQLWNFFKAKYILAGKTLNIAIGEAIKDYVGK